MPYASPMGNEKGPLWVFFYKHARTNSKHDRASCRACIDYTLKHPPQEWAETEPPTDLTPEEEAQFNRACDVVGDVGGVMSSMAAHILGYSRHSACPHVSQRVVAEANKLQAEAKACKDGGSAPPPVTGKCSHTAANNFVDATSESGMVLSSAASWPAQAKRKKQGTFKVISRKKSTYEPEERAAIEIQVTRAIISTSLVFVLFENEEMRKLFDMIRDGTGDVLPSRKVSSRRLLNTCAAGVENKLKQCRWLERTDQELTYPIKLINATALPKDGPGLCKQFAKIIDEIEEAYKCIIIYFITDTDSGSLKG
ncbi:hypothetical protein B0H10DRAFT_1957769 [Mycena sp. CBHHK59/15]|nr:hypothetical protein B0H10DRAFT_1957769 [Mycena sp. CBHHK59/15]